MTQVQLAEQLARQAHADQRELSTGDPYVYHLERVAGLVDGDDAKAVAWLHDVLEDQPVTVQDLRAAGLSERVIAAVVWLTRPPRTGLGTTPQAYAAYIESIALSGDTLALAVKLADLKDHLRPNCPERLRPRYERAWTRLTAL